MANDFSAGFPEIWAKEQEVVFYKKNVAMAIADVSYNADMRYGDTLTRVYRSQNTVPWVYTPGTDITIDDKTDTAEQLLVNKKYANGIYIDSFDDIQSMYNLAAAYGKDNGEYLSNQVDSDVLGEVFNATSTVDDGTLGGTSGNGISLTSSNVLQVVAQAKKKLQRQNIQSTDLYGVISPDFEQKLIEYGAGRDTKYGDELNQNGYIMDFYGFKLYMSNQLACSAILALATQPTDGDTVVIEGKTFTFKTVLWSTAGNVLIGASADAARANLATLINTPWTTTSTGVALTGNNLKLFVARVTATNDDTNNILTVKSKGSGVIAVSETLTDGTDTWTTTKIKQHNLFGVKGNPVLVMQRSPSVVMKEEPKKLGKNVLNGVLYGVKTFADNAKQMVNVEIACSTF